MKLQGRNLSDYELFTIFKNWTEPQVYGMSAPLAAREAAKKDLRQQFQTHWSRCSAQLTFGSPYRRELIAQVIFAL